MSKPNLGLSRKAKTTNKEAMTFTLERKKVLLAQANINLDRAKKEIEPLTISDTIMYLVNEYLNNKSL